MLTIPLGQLCKQKMLGLFVCLTLNCMSSLYILDKNPLSELLFENTFSHLVSCLFVLLVVSFALQKLSNIICTTEHQTNKQSN